MARGVPEPRLVHEHLAWAYANLARAHAAISEGAIRYSTVHHLIRSKLYKGLVTGTMSLGSILDDERLKLLRSPACSYCGSLEGLALDHLLPRSRGMSDRPDNLVLACRRCNSSKGPRDCLAWLAGSGRFPSLLLLRRYLKLAYSISNESGWLSIEMKALAERDPPFDPENFPIHFPALPVLRL